MFTGDLRRSYLTDIKAPYALVMMSGHKRKENCKLYKWGVLIRPAPGPLGIISTYRAGNPHSTWYTYKRLMNYFSSYSCFSPQQKKRTQTLMKLRSALCSHRPSEVILIKPTYQFLLVKDKFILKAKGACKDQDLKKELFPTLPTCSVLSQCVCFHILMQT